MKFARSMLVISLFSAAALAQDKPGACAAKLKGSAPVQVKLTTTMGPIVLQLEKDKAHLSAQNFATYVDAGQYNGTVFHRVIDGFMIQGGGFTRDMTEKPTRAAIKNEADNGLKNDTYTVAMARRPDPNSATGQFFINVKNNDMLNHREPSPQGWGYAVFGKVVEGKETVDKIKAVPTGNQGPYQNVPSTPVVIEKAECL
jgi:cyclophilin family peptidyl-prolyl cis-trans isomerase